LSALTTVASTVSWLDDFDHRALPIIVIVHFAKMRMLASPSEDRGPTWLSVARSSNDFGVGFARRFAREVFFLRVISASRALGASVDDALEDAMSGPPTKASCLAREASSVVIPEFEFSILAVAWAAEGEIGARSWFDRCRVVGRTTSDDRDERGDGSCDGNHFTYGLSRNWPNRSRISSRSLASRLSATELARGG
jgi:hypothetical protein